MARDRARQVAIAALAAAIGVGAIPPAGRAQGAAAVDEVVGRMHAYLAEYAKHLPAVIATEHYHQRTGSGSRRNQRRLVSDYGLILVPGDSEWLGFREVLSVDGKPVADSASRLAALFENPSAVAVRQARRIAEESARYNLGPVIRTINDPALVLEFLDRRNAGRIRFEKQDEAGIDGVRVWVLRFQEVGTPTIIRTKDLRDLPARGRAWIEPSSGRVLRAEAIIEPGLGVTGSLDVRFEHDERLGFAVPAKMTERYTNRNLVTVSSGEATYDNYRRFQVDTEETIFVK